MFTIAFSLLSCNEKAQNQQEVISLLDAKDFQKQIEGKQINLYKISNDSGMTLELTNYGARMVSLWVDSNEDTFKDVIWGYESIDAYLQATDIYSGPIVGRFGNRINKGKFSIDDKEYQLTINNGDNHLHGGLTGLYQQIWDVTLSNDSMVTLAYLSPDNEGGYPGNASIEVTYKIAYNNKLEINYKATTDAPTPMNLTSHSYFNLHGTTDKSTNTHILQIYADSYTPTDAGLIPTGEVETLDGSPLDFRTAATIGSRINDTTQCEALKYGSGYDHNYVLKDYNDNNIFHAANVYEPTTGIVMDIYTDQRGLQFYSGNFMDGVDTGKRGEKHNYRTGIALETQNFPDAPNHIEFADDAILRPGEVYSHRCIYAFSVKNTKLI